ncbi:site-specific integrase [Azospirillum picis]|uniref:Integrase n=1 Tax=Azospirillum picis TaxID=488438 RepID=A0ABU0MVB0_9PROT|nr:site-specific integrase [Azospirillum picis]MBP2303597.1 integrase [Azospirillum picis]MDQ0537432.1 integrase [Azospirillum picis]
MAGDRYITRSHNTFLFQMSVPSDCQAVVGKKLVRKSLKTGDRRIAAQRARPLIDHWHREFDRIRGRELALAEAAPRLRKLGFKEPLTEENVRCFARVAEQEAHWRFKIQAGKLRSLGIEIDVDGALRPLRAEQEDRLSHIREAVALVTGENPAVKPRVRTAMDDLFDRWKREARPTPNSTRECEYSVRRFREMFGNVEIRSITKPMVRQFRDAMLEVPTRINNEEAAMPLPKLLEKYHGKNVDRSSVASARKRLSFLKTLLTTAVDAGIIEESPADGVKIKDDGAKPDQARRAFTYAELELIGRKLAEKDDTFRWVTILGITTGCRLGEIAQLTVNDVQSEDGVMFLSINAADGKSIKTASSVRRVPLHPDIKQSFLDFIKKKKDRIFPDIQPSANDNISDLISKRWNHWRKNIGFNEKGLCFHSLRHSFKDRCREAGIAEEIHDALTGHSGGGVGRRYGGRPPLRVLADAVAKLKFPVASASSAQ